MKKLSVILVIMLCLIPKPTFTASAEKVKYAHMENDTILYSTSETEYIPIVTLPATYFVAILAENSDGYYSVSYADIIGFIKKEDVKTVDYEPKTKHMLGSIATSNDGQGVNLRKRPDHNDTENILKVIPSEAENIVYYGSIDGSAIIPQVGTKWYYARFTADKVSTYGYVYVGQVTAQQITDNVIEKVDNPKDDDVDIETDPAPITMSKTLSVIFTIALIIPALFIMFLLFKKPNDTPRKPRHFDE